MRGLIVDPGPSYSVADVHRGWCEGLRANGVELVEYPFADRLYHAQRFHRKIGDEYRQCFDFETAVLYALEPLGAWIYEAQPDFVMFVSGFWLRQAPFQLIRKRGQKVVLLCTESPYEDDVQLGKAAVSDLTILNDPTNLDRFREVCPASFYFPHSYRPQVHKPGLAIPELASDLCVVGTGYPSRVRFLEQMDLSEIEVRLRGNWESLEGHELAKYAPTELDECVDNDQAVSWYNSTRASLNLYRREANATNLVDGWSMTPREVELAASGTFFMSEARGENVEMLPDVPKISDPLEASDLLRYYLANDSERERIIRANRSAISSWTFAERARSFLQQYERL